MLTKHSSRAGFALPTVVIASVVMLIVLVTAVGAISSARVALNAQYDEQRLRDAAESGAARAQDCIGNSLMTLNVVVTPATNCDGSTIPGRSLYITGGVAGSTYRTSYQIKLTESSAQSKKVSVNGMIDSLRKSNGGVVSSKTLPLAQTATMVLDPSGDRITQRYWYFGDRVVMDFGADGSSMPTFSVNPTTTTLVQEGATVVTDQDGNMVFWSNGLNIWDKTGAAMSNSSGLTGAYSATQAVASFPMNAARTQYGVVSNSGQGETGYGELYLSIIDLNLNGGLGAVTSKNVKLGTGTGYAGEGLGAMPNADGTGYWVYTFNAVTGLVTRFLVKNAGGVNGPFTTTFSPATMKCVIGSTGMSGYGSFNFTKDYSRMVVMAGAYACNGTNGGGANDNGMVYIYNTNTTTGALTLQASWVSSGWIGSAGGAHGGYTADFSPLENYVYVGQVYPGMLTRYDIQTPTSAAIKASEWPISFDTLDTNTAHIRESGAHIRRGPDGRMWIADRAVSYYPKTFEGAAASTPCKMSYISAPDSPTETGTGIGLKLDAITLPAGSCSIWGLPQMATVFKPRIVLY